MEQLYNDAYSVMETNGLSKIYLTVQNSGVLEMDCFRTELYALEDKIIQETYGFVPIYAVKLNKSDSYSEFMYKLESTGLLEMLSWGETTMLLEPHKVGRTVHCYPESWSDYKEVVTSYCYDLEYNTNLYEELINYVENGYLDEEMLSAMSDVPSYLTSRSYGGSENMALAMIEQITYDSILYYA